MFKNTQSDCEFAEMNKKGYCNWCAKSYGGLRKCDHPHYMYLEARLCCPYYWKVPKED